MTLRLTLSLALAAALPTPSLHAQTTLATKTCGQVSGRAPVDAQHVRSFCAQWVPPAIQVVDAAADGGVLWLNVRRSFANTILSDRLTGEQLLRGWIAKWRGIAATPGGRIIVLLGEIEVAKIETTALSGDKVTFYSQ